MRRVNIPGVEAVVFFSLRSNGSEDYDAGNKIGSLKKAIALPSLLERQHILTRYLDFARKLLAEIREGGSEEIISINLRDAANVLRWYLEAATSFRHPLSDELPTLVEELRTFLPSHREQEVSSGGMGRGKMQAVFNTLLLLTDRTWWQNFMRRRTAGKNG